MSYFVELPGLDKAGLSRLWQCLEVAADYATSDDSGFHFAGPMEFRFMKGGKAAMSGTYTTNPDAYFVNLDLLAFTEPTSGKGYPDALLKAFAHVERTWVKLGGLPHNGKMYGFYDPNDSNPDSYTPPFNEDFVNFVRGERKKRGAPVDAFVDFAKSRDPNGMFNNPYVRNLLGI